MATPNYDLVMVQWRDAHSQDGWIDRKELDLPVNVVTVGVVVKEDEHFLAVAGSFGCEDDDNEVATTMVIPKAMISDRKVIRKNICGKRAQSKLHPKSTAKIIHREPSASGPILKPNG